MDLLFQRKRTFAQIARSSMEIKRQVEQCELRNDHLLVWNHVCLPTCFCLRVSERCLARKWLKPITSYIFTRNRRCPWPCLCLIFKHLNLKKRLKVFERPGQVSRKTDLGATFVWFYFHVKAGELNKNRFMVEQLAIFM